MLKYSPFFRGTPVFVVKRRIQTRKHAVTAQAFFRFGKNPLRSDAETAGMTGNQKRDDFRYDDVEQYFNYMGMLAVDGSYDRMEAYLNAKIHPVDILLLWASAEGDDPKVEELLRAGADPSVKDMEGNSPLDLAGNERVKELLSKD